MINKRSKGFPRLSLKNAVQIIDKAMKYGRNWSKEEFATFGSKSNTKGSANSGAFAYRLAALRDYGLITSTKDGVLATELASRIVKPINDDEYREAIKEAFLGPDVFKDIVNSVEHDIELSKTAIAEIAVRKLGISRDYMNRFAKNFLESGKLAGIIKEIDADHFKIQQQQTINQHNTEQTDFTKTDQSLTQEETIGSHTQEGLMGTDQFTTSSSNEASLYGAQHKGQSWQLNLQVLVDLHVPTDLRKEIRNLVEKADSIADQLYKLDEKGRNEM